MKDIIVILITIVAYTFSFIILWLASALFLLLVFLGLENEKLGTFMSFFISFIFTILFFLLFMNTFHPIGEKTETNFNLERWNESLERESTFPQQKKPNTIEVTENENMEFQIKINSEKDRKKIKAILEIYLRLAKEEIEKLLDSSSGK